MSNPSQNKPDADERQRAAQAVELRVQGHPYALIAERLGWADESGARHAVSRLLDRREVESVNELRAVHSARLEGVLSSFWPAATSGDTDAARIVLRTLDSIAKLFSLDAPARVAVDAQVSEVEFANEAARLIERIASLGGTDDFLRTLPGTAGHAVLTGSFSSPTVPDAIDADWSNIHGYTNSDDDTDADDEFADVPDDVLDRAEAASMTIIGEYRRQREEVVAP